MAEINKAALKAASEVLYKLAPCCLDPEGGGDLTMAAVAFLRAKKAFDEVEREAGR